MSSSLSPSDQLQHVVSIGSQSNQHGPLAQQGNRIEKQRKGTVSKPPTLGAIQKGKLSRVPRHPRPSTRNQQGSFDLDATDTAAAIMPRTQGTAPPAGRNTRSRNQLSSQKLPNINARSRTQAAKASSARRERSLSLQDDDKYRDRFPDRNATISQRPGHGMARRQNLDEAGEAEKGTRRSARQAKRPRTDEAHGPPSKRQKRRPGAPSTTKTPSQATAAGSRRRHLPPGQVKSNKVQHTSRERNDDANNAEDADEMGNASKRPSEEAGIARNSQKVTQKRTLTLQVNEEDEAIGDDTVVSTNSTYRGEGEADEDDAEGDSEIADEENGSVAQSSKSRRTEGSAGDAPEELGLHEKLHELDEILRGENNPTIVGQIGNVHRWFNEVFQQTPECGSVDDATEAGARIPSNVLDDLDKQYQSIFDLCQTRPEGRAMLNFARDSAALHPTIPPLLEILELFVSLYCRLEHDPDGWNVSKQRRSLWLASALVKAIVEIGKLARMNESGRPLARKGKKAVYKHLILPLKVHDVALERIKQACFAIDRRRQLEMEHASALEERMRQAAERRVAGEELFRSRRIRAKWQYLHVERIIAHEMILTSAENAHLELHRVGTDVDQNMQHFQRIEVFRERQGPLPGFVEQAKLKEWAAAPLQALCDGLQKHCGPMVFERIMREHCGPRGPLHQYNVTEIVTMAAMLKEELIKSQEAMDGMAAFWVEAIPVWTEESGLKAEDLRTNDVEERAAQDDGED